MTEITPKKVEMTMPAKLVNIIDAAAARELTSRSAWIRLAIMDRAVRDGLIRLAPEEGVSVYDAELSRVLG